MVKLPEASFCTSVEVNAGMGYMKERDEYVVVHLFEIALHQPYKTIYVFFGKNPVTRHKSRSSFYEIEISLNLQSQSFIWKFP